MSRAQLHKSEVIPFTEAATQLGISYYVCRDLMLRRVLTGVRQGRLWFITLSSLDEELAKRKADREVRPANGQTKTDRFEPRW